MTLAKPQRDAALAAGLSLFVMVVLAPFGLLPIEALRLADPGTVVAQLGAELPRIRLAILAMFGMAVLDVVVAWGLSVRFNAGAAGLVQLSSWFRLSYATVLAVMLAPVLDAVRMVEAGAASGADVHHALSRFYDGWELGLILFAIHLLLLGWALIASRQAPMWIAALVVLSGAGYLIDGIGRVLDPGYGLNLALYVFAGELVLAIWLVWTAFRR